MRKILFGLLLVGAAAPALAAGGPRHRDDDNNDQNRPPRAWHQERNDDRGERPQFERPAPQRQEFQRQEFQRQDVQRQDVQRQEFQRPQFQRPEFERPAPQQRSDFQRPQFGGNVQRPDDRYVRGEQAPNAFGTWRRSQPDQQRWSSDRVRSDGYVRDNNTWQQQQRYSNGYARQGTQQPRYADRRRDDGNRWNRDWRNDRRYDWRDYRRRNPSRFHIGVYVDPFGWGYQNFGIGYRLQPNYFEQNYWVDPGMYGLPYPPPGMQWVRYWNDALLIDMYSGQVVDEIQGFFW